MEIILTLSLSDGTITQGGTMLCPLCQRCADEFCWNVASTASEGAGHNRLFAACDLAGLAGHGLGDDFDRHDGGGLQNSREEIAHISCPSLFDEIVRQIM